MTRARKTAALLAAGLLSLGACGGGSEDDAAAPTPAPAAITAAPVPTGDDAKITDLARSVLLSQRSPDLCREKFSAKFVRTVFRSVAKCEGALGKKDKDPSDDTVDVQVSEIKVNGLAATATVTEYMRDQDSASGTWAFLRAGDEWRVAAWGVDYLRSGFRTVFGPNYRSSGVDDLLGDPATRSCVGAWVEQRPDASFTRLAHGIVRADKRFLNQLRERVASCAAVPDASGISPLRRVFENHLRTAATKAGRPELADCTIRRTRVGITDEHLTGVQRMSKPPAWLDRRLKNIGLDCALAQVRAIPSGDARDT